VKITAESVPDRQVVLQIELEAPEIEEHKQRTYRKLVNRYVIPGFRRGKTPRTILERYLGEETFVQEDLEDLLERIVMQAVEQEKLEPVARPQITEVASLAPITFKATIPLKPEIDLGDYKSIHVPWEEPTVSDEDVQETLDALRRQGTPWEPADRPAQLGDLVTIDVTGYVEEPAGAEGEGGSLDEKVDVSGETQKRTFIEEKGISYFVQETVTYPVPGFAEQLAGMKSGDTKEFTVHAPDDFTVRDLNGKDCHFTVTLQEVKEQKLPEATDEWAKGVTYGEQEGFESVEALTARVRADLQERTEAQAHAEYEEKVLDVLAEKAKLSYPPVLVESEIDHLLQDQDDRLRGVGISLASYLANTGQDPQVLRDSVREQAQQRVVRALLVSELTEKEGIQVSDEEIDAEVTRVVDAQPEGDAREQARQLFQSEAARDTIKRRLVARKAMEFLVSAARGESGGAPAQEAEAGEAEKKPAARSRRRAAAES
jgi:trigger factor